MDYAFCKKAAQQIHRFRSGKPCKHYAITLNHICTDPLLIGDFLIWKKNQGPASIAMRTAYVLNLHTWSLRTLVGEARESLRGFAASEQVVAVAASTNLCYVWDLHTSEMKKFRVPNHTYFEALTCGERTVACAAALTDEIIVYIWEFDSQLGKTFRITGREGHHFFQRNPKFVSSLHYSIIILTTFSCVHAHNLALLLQPKSESIIVFADIDCNRYTSKGKICPTVPSDILHCRYTYNGVCLESSYRNTNGRMPVHISPEAHPLLPVDTQGNFALTAGDFELGAFRPIRLQFDSKAYRFVAASDPFNGRTMHRYIQYTTSWWKDTFYGIPWSEEEIFARGKVVMGTATCVVMRNRHYEG